MSPVHRSFGSNFGRSVGRFLLSILSVGLARAPSSDALAQERAWIGAGLEVFGTHALDDENRERFGLGGGAALHGEFSPIDALSIHAGGVILGLSSSGGDSSTEWYGGRLGLRLHWSVLYGEPHDDGWLDAHYAVGASGQIVSSGFDVGVGYDFTIVPGLRIGPFARLQWMADPAGRDPWLLSIGASVGVFGDPRVDVRPDTDRDGVLDVDDHCPTEPQGANPDPQRPGCPLGDLDGDGVLDPNDECPRVHHGERPDPEHPGCPAADRDRDGVLDPDDLCPDEHHGLHPDPARAGCPLGDRDGDTVVDPVDACPDEPGAPSTDPARNGCPGLVRIRHGQVEILRPVYFATGRDTILEESFPVLAAVVDAVQASGIERLRVEGHTDAVGPDEFNLELSRRRAESVRRWLIQHGIAEQAVVAEGFGETRPVESNDSEMGRAANRRVEFHIVDQGGAQ